MFNKSIKFRIYPNKCQTEMLFQHFGANRFVYNYFLNQINQQYKVDKTSKVPSAFDLNKQITILKNTSEYSWLKDIHSQTLQQSVSHLSDAFKRFFKKQSKYPKFKSKYNSHQSFTFPQGIKIVDEKSIKVPKFGIFKAKVHKIIDENVKLKSCTISKTPTDQYYVSIVLEYDGNLPVPTIIEKDKSIGIDLGITHYAITSNGKKYDNPKYFRKSQEKLTKHQKIFSRSKKKSINYNKRKKMVSNIHEKIKNQRKDFQHKLSHELVYKSQDTTFVLETLSVKNMVKNRKLAKSISDCGWSSFVDMLKYKSKYVGKNVIQINRFFPSSKTCSTCGIVVNKLPLSIREWSCECCDTHHDRDINASINILKFGLKIPY